MSSGYDLSVSTISPDGRVFQVEYAQKAADSSPTVVAVKAKDGIVVACARFPMSPAVVPGVNPQIFAIDKHIIAAICGLIPDGRALVQRARLEAAEFKKVWAEPIPAAVLADRLSQFIAAYTMAWTERPFGSHVILAVATDDATELWAVDVVAYRYSGIARGKGSALAKTELEKLDKDSLTCEDAAFHLAKILYKAHEEQAAERRMELEMACLRPSRDEAAYLPQILERSVVDSVSEKAKAAIAQEQMSDDDEEMAAPAN